MPYCVPGPEAHEIVFPSRTAGVLTGFRAGARPRDMLGRVQLLMLAFGLLNAGASFTMVLMSGVGSPGLWIGALAGSVALAGFWTAAYRRGTMSYAADAVTIGALCLITIAVDSRWDGYLYVMLAAAVTFTSGYGSLPRVLLRTATISAIELGEGVADPAAMTMAIVFAVGFIVVSVLMNGMIKSIARYEATARREQVLAATGLDLVAATDVASIATAAVESGLALCASIRGARVAIAFVEPAESDQTTFHVIDAMGDGAEELKGARFDIGEIVAPGHRLADQRLIGVHAGGAGDPDAPACPFRPGELLATRVGAEDGTLGVLTIESDAPIPDDLPASIRALASQVSLALARANLQTVAIERETLERFEALIAASADVITVASLDGTVRFQSPSVKQVFGYRVEEITGRNLQDLVHPEDWDRVRAGFRQVAEEPAVPLLCECRFKHSDGSWRHTETRMSNFLHVKAIGGIVLNTRDVTERHALEAELRHQAFHDSLTGLANRALFINRVDHALIQSRRHDTTVAVLYCDIDGMSRLSDSLGYAAGESALTAVADRLRACVRGEDTVARLGGTEFGVLLDRLTSSADATLAMERVMATLRQAIQLPGAQIELHPRIGIVVSTGGDESAENLLRNGAVAMHQARSQEGGYALFDPEMQADAMRRIEVESELRTALEEGQFVLHYQPTIDLKTGRLTGVEALVRWQHPRRGLVPPMEFIPLAEESGLIVPLGQWTIKEACRQVRYWQQEIPADEPIILNVNLSARQLRHPNIVRDVADALDDSGLLSSRLVLEITESVLMVDSAATLNRLFQLKSLGVRLAIDDFGTGYSSFAYLRRFPVDILKIDKSFVDGVATEATSGALVDAMIRIGKTLRLETVAEGVERAEQADRLRSLQCDMGQGYLFSRPIPSEAITGLLRERAAAGIGPVRATAA